MKKRLLSMLLVLVMLLGVLPVTALADKDHDGGVSEKTQIDWKQFYGFTSSGTMQSRSDDSAGKCTVYLGTGDNKTQWTGTKTQADLAASGITIVPDEGYYVKQVVIACDDKGGYNCQTAKRDGIARFGAASTASAEYVIPAEKLGLNVKIDGNPVWHSGAGSPKHLMIWLGTSPNPVEVTYDSGIVALDAPIISFGAAAEEVLNSGISFVDGSPSQSGNTIT